MPTKALCALGAVAVAAVLGAGCGEDRLEVNTTADLQDVNPGDGVCEAASGNGQCSVRGAVQESNARPGRQFIYVPAGSYVLQFEPGDAVGETSSLLINDDVTLQGDGPESTFIEGESVFGGPLLYIPDDVDVGLMRLTFRNGGTAQAGGGIRQDAGNLVLFEVVVRDSHAVSTGGGIYTGGELTLNYSTVTDNEVDARGGGIYVQGDGELFLNNSTVSRNLANAGAGIQNFGRVVAKNSTISTNAAQFGPGGFTNVGVAVLNNVTIAFNTAGENEPNRAGGVGNVGSNLFSFRNSILAGNENTGGGPNDCAGTLSSAGYNLIEDPSGCSITNHTIHNITEQEAQLGSLQLNGGRGENHLLLAASPAVDAGWPHPPGGGSAQACEGEDQRDVVRLICDVGAIEREVAVPEAVTVNTMNDAADHQPGDGTCETGPGNGICSLRAAVQETNVLPGPQTIDLPVGTYQLTIPGSGEDHAETGDLDITDTLTIQGGGAAATIVDGGGLDRVFENRVGVTASISGVTLRNGNATSGGAVNNLNGDLTLTDVAALDSQATFGGGIHSTIGSLTMTRVAVSGNSAGSGGGGISVGSGGDLTLTNAVVAGNESSNSGGGLDFSGSGTLTVVDVTFDGNEAVRGGGASAVSGSFTNVTFDSNIVSQNGGGFLTVGSPNLTNVTFSGNTAGTGGAIANSGSASLTHVTIVGNSGTSGPGGILQFGASSSTTVRNTLIGANPGANCGGLPITSAGHNLFSGTSCAAGADDITGVPPRVLAIADNGGSTQTHALRADSAAVDAAADAGVATDQRGVARPSGGGFDIGAFERSGQ